MSTDQDRAAAAIHALLALANGRGLRMTRTKIVNLLYLADLRSVAEDGQARSGVLWRWWRYGPYCQALRSAEDGLVDIGAVERETWQLSAFTAEHRLTANPKSTPNALHRAGEFLTHLDAVLEEHGRKSAQSLTDIAYRTKPMIEAQAEGARGMLLDLDEQPDPPDMDKVRAELAQRFEHVPSADMTTIGPDGYPDADEIVGVFRGNRAHANSILLG